MPGRVRSRRSASATGSSTRRSSAGATCTAPIRVRDRAWSTPICSQDQDGTARSRSAAGITISRRAAASSPGGALHAEDSDLSITGTEISTAGTSAGDSPGGAIHATNSPLEITDATIAAYADLLEGLEAKFADVENGTSRRKQARQAARAVLPNATETRIVVTGNYRAWRHFIAMRAGEAADVEIRALAIQCLRAVSSKAPNVFADFTIVELPDGTEVATSPMSTEG